MGDWKTDLEEFFEAQRERAKKEAEERRKLHADIDQFCNQVLQPAFKELKVELEKHDRQVSISLAKRLIQIACADQAEYGFEIRFKGRYVKPVNYTINWETLEPREPAIAGAFRGNATIDDVTKEDILQSVVKEYISELRIKEQAEKETRE